LVSSVAIGAGVVLIVLLAPIALLAFSPPGDCFSESCQQERRFGIDVAGRQAPIAFGWLLVALSLGLAARRRPWLWLLIAALCGVIAGAGLLVYANGIRTSISTPAGVAVLDISLAFYAWLPGSLCLAVGTLIRWAALRT
jgi:hypothetical protein